MMITQNRIITILILAALAMSLVFTAAPANAATISTSTTAPDVGPIDVANYTGTLLDKWWYYGDEWAGGVPGQTFTTGDVSVRFSAVTYQIADSQKALPTKTYRIRLSTVDRVDPGDSTTWVLGEIHIEEAIQDLTWNNSEFMTWTLDTPVELAANTEYGIDVGMTDSTTYWTTGIAYIKYSGSDEYAGGTRYWSGAQPNVSVNEGGIGNSTMRSVSGERVFHFDILSNDPNRPTVVAGDDKVTWSGEPVQLAPTVTNNDAEIPARNLTYHWSADPDDGVIFSATDVEAPTVTITKATENPSVVALTLEVNLEGELPESVVEVTLTIDVYDDACKAAVGTGAVFDPGDIDKDCDTGLDDLAQVAAAWLYDYTLTEPAPKP